MGFGGFPLEKARLTIQQCQLHTTFSHPPLSPSALNNSEISNRIGNGIGKARGGTDSAPTSLHVFKPKVRPELGARQGKAIELGVTLKFVSG